MSRPEVLEQRQGCASAEHHQNDHDECHEAHFDISIRMFFELLGETTSNTHTDELGNQSPAWRSQMAADLKASVRVFTQEYACISRGAREVAGIKTGTVCMRLICRLRLVEKCELLDRE